MLRNYLIIAFRNLRRRTGYALINVLGLSVGIACVLLIGLFVRDELSYDRFSTHADQTHRLVAGDQARVPGSVAPALKEAYPDLIEATAQFWPLFAPAKLRRGDVVFVEENIAFADASALHVMDYSLTVGDADAALTAPNAIVLSASMARKYFGEASAVGQTMTFWGRDLQVEGVMADVPRTAHYRPDALVSMPTLRRQVGSDLAEFPMYSYVLLRTSAAASQLETALDRLPRPDATSVELQAQPLTAIHFATQIEGNPRPGGNWAYVVMLMFVALFVLGLAVVNFVNLSTAQAMLRAKEVGLRKTLGARRPQLIQQFLGESILLTFCAVVGAFAWVEAALPLFEAISGKPAALWRDARLLWSGVALGTGGVVALLAGSYPAFFLSRFQPAHVLKGIHTGLASGATLRKGLVVVQFAVAIALIAAVGVIYQQARYLQERDLGYEEENVLVLDGDRFPVLKQALLDVPGVTHVTGAPRLMGQPLPTGAVRVPGRDSSQQMLRMPVSLDYIETMDMRVTAGRRFTLERGTDASEAVMLNETAAQMLGGANPVGRRLTMEIVVESGETQTVEGTVIGVVDDFHYLSLHNPIGPVVLYLSRDPNLVFARLDSPDAVTLARVEAAWSTINPDAPLNAYFLGDHLRQAYQTERQLMRLFGGFAGLALLVACLGLFGLMAFITNQRTKEIGIRKALGATAVSLVTLLSSDFAKLVGIAFAVAVPVAYLGMSRWLEGFAYRIDLGAGVFVAAGALALVVALATVGVQAWRAARLDPTKALRSE
ncbi:MAG: FtsX-like permease family protein [Bacteroidetes bacterium]|jgi:putative ABC transport system permease protein|nr:FtsX-like permease family protein [Bacteroidota bacterium]